jgi:hypothetical protein
MIDDAECGAVGGMIGRRNRSAQRKPAPVPLCPPQIPHDLIRARTRAAAAESQPLTARAMVRPYTQFDIEWNFISDLREQHRLRLRRRRRGERGSVRGKQCVMKRLTTSTLHGYDYSYTVLENEISRAQRRQGHTRS